MAWLPANGRRQKRLRGFLRRSVAIKSTSTKSTRRHRFRAVFHESSGGKVLQGPSIPYNSMPSGRPTPGQPNGRPVVGGPQSGCSIFFFCEPTRSVWLTMILIGSVICLLLFVRSFFVSQHNSVWLTMILIGSVCMYVVCCCM
jgi:hypothetical protein